MFDDNPFEEEDSQEKTQEPPSSIAEVAFSTIHSMSRYVGLHDDHRITNALKTIWIDPTNEEVIKELFSEVMEFLEPEYRIAEMYQSPFEPLPLPEESVGDIHIGTIFDLRVGKTIGPHEEWPSQNFALRFKELNEHTLIVGRSGSGKTSLIANMLIQLIRRGVPCWAIDFYRDYRGLVNLFPDKVLIIRWEDFKFNPLRPPPGVSVRTWIARFTDILCEALVGFRGAKNVFQEQITRLFDKYNVEHTNVFPTLHDLDHQLNTINPKKISWRSRQHLGTAESILQMTTRNLGDMLDCDEGHPIEKLLKMSVVFELDGLGEDIKPLFVNLLLGWVLTYRIATGQREGYETGEDRHKGLKNIIAFDEAKMIFDRGREKDKRGGIPYLMEAVATVRKFGIGFIVADQMWNMLARSILANIHTKIFLSCQDKDLQDISRYIGLRGKGQVDQLQNLPPFHSIIKLASRHMSPFRIFFQLPKYDRQVDDLEIEMKSGFILEKLGWKPPKKKKEEYEEDLETKEDEDIIEGEIIEVTDLPSVLSPEAGDLLRDIFDNPFSVVTERYERLGLTPDKGDSTKDHLIQNEIIKQDTAEYGRGGGRVVILSLTDKGEDLLGKKSHISGKGGMEHRYNQHRAYVIFQERDYICEIEAKHSDLGESIDVVAKKDNHVIGIEIELGNDLEQPIKNLKKCLEHRCTKVLVFCNTTLRNKLKKEIRQLDYSDNDRDKIDLVPISYLAQGADKRTLDEWLANLEQRETIETEEKTVVEVMDEEPEPIVEETEGSKVHLGFDTLTKKSIFWDPSTSTNPHIMIVGMSGSGKTETLRSFIYELYEKGMPSIVFDFHGDYYKEDFKNIVNAQIIDHDKGININPLELSIDPESGKKLKPSKIVSEIAEIINGVYKLGSQQKPTLENAIFYAYESVGILRNEPDTWELDPPSFNQIQKGLVHLDALEDKKNTVAGNVQTKINKVFEENLFPDEGVISVNSLFEGVTILNLKALAWDKNLQMTLSRFFLKKIYNEMIKRKLSEKVNLFCFIDEAHKVISDDSIIEIVREARKFGLGLVMGSHSPKDFHADVFSNTATKIVLRGTVGRDSNVTIDNLGVFKKKDRDKIKTEMLALKPGEAFLVSDHYHPYVKVRILPLASRV